MLKTINLSHQVSLTSGPLVILNNIHLSIKAGESVAIVGASGSGKSTLLAMLAGLDIPSQGQIFIAGDDITLMDEEQRALARALHVSFVFQDFQLLSSLTAIENVMLALEVRDSARGNAIQSKAEHFLSRVGLSERSQHYPKQLSGGEQQRVAIARAFACEAPILFADEPTGNLDSETGKTIADLLFSMNKEAGTTLVLVTHDVDLAARCNRRLLMSAGTLAEQL